MWIRAITEKASENQLKKEITILWVKYSIRKYWPKIYIFDEEYFTPAKWLLKTPNWEQVYDIEDLWKNTKDWWFPVFKFMYYTSDWYSAELIVYTEDWKKFFNLWDKLTINKPVETSVQNEVWKRKWLVKRVVDRVMHPKRKK